MSGHSRATSSVIASSPSTTTSWGGWTDARWRAIADHDSSTVPSSHAVSPCRRRSGPPRPASPTARFTPMPRRSPPARAPVPSSSTTCGCVSAGGRSPSSPARSASDVCAAPAVAGIAPTCPATWAVRLYDIWVASSVRRSSNRSVRRTCLRVEQLEQRREHPLADPADHVGEPQHADAGGQPPTSRPAALASEIARRAAVFARTRERRRQPPLGAPAAAAHALEQPLLVLLGDGLEQPAGQLPGGRVAQRLPLRPRRLVGDRVYLQRQDEATLVSHRRTSRFSQKGLGFACASTGPQPRMSTV